MSEWPPKDPDRNVTATAEQLAKIRRLSDFDLIMLISEINGYGWAEASKTLEMMRPFS